ncbi:suppressor of lurcher protein 1 [Asbolus verrucosus]|uniref:Suppressor of lurcher protein 1 n=1 Tax=Asbolus verrucosus TaxID=1661398 RepID=A0A482VSS8_ASBVE|nr:suppressor of lurcher protein 1 [Asbolus verrucosus]
MENSLLLCKLALKNFRNVFLLTLLVFLIKTIHFSVKNFVTVFTKTESINKKKATSRRTKKTPVEKVSWRQLLQNHLEMFPYKVRICHKILLRDFVPKMNYYEWFLHHVNDNILDVTFFTDVAWFHLECYVKRNMRTWSIGFPHIPITRLTGRFILSGSSCDVVINSDTNKNGTIASPSYPAPYPSRTTCRYEFQGRGKERVQIVFQDFNLYRSTDDSTECDNQDSLMAFVHIDGRMEKIDSFCGSTLPKPVMSNGPRLKLEFQSLFASRYSRGFKATYSFTEKMSLYSRQYILLQTLVLKPVHNCRTTHVPSYLIVMNLEVDFSTAPIILVFTLETRNVTISSTETKRKKYIYILVTSMLKEFFLSISS